MKTDVVCPYCKKRFEAEVEIAMNPYIKDAHPATVFAVGISKYYKLKGENK